VYRVTSVQGSFERVFFRANATLTPGMIREFRESFFSYKSNFNARDDKGVSREFFFVGLQTQH